MLSAGSSSRASERAGSSASSTFLRLAPLTLVAALLLPTRAPAGEPDEIEPPEPSYYRPVIVDGMTFPVARASWLSAVEQAKDWHAPRMRKVDGRWVQVGRHQGNDISAEPDTPILSITSGMVEQVGWTFYSGERVGVRGDDGRYYFYAHLSSYGEAARVGRPVSAGDVLGRVGDTGYGPPGHTDEFPPHLHVGIQEAGGIWVDPYPLLRRLHRAAARTTARLERRLASMRAEGDRDGHERLAARLHANLS